MVLKLKAPLVSSYYNVRNQCIQILIQTINADFLNPAPGPPPAATRPKKTPPVAPKPKKSPPAPPKQTQIQPSQQQGEESRKISLQATFQFPPEEDEVEQEEDSDEAPHTPTKHQPSYNKLPSSSALKKSPGDGSRKRSPAFKERYIDKKQMFGNLYTNSDIQR